MDLNRPINCGPHRQRVSSLLDLGDTFRPFVGSHSAVTIASGWGHPLQTVHTVDGLERAWRLSEPWRLAMASAVRAAISRKRRADFPRRYVHGPDWEEVMARAPLVNEENWNGVRHLTLEEPAIERVALDALFFAQRNLGSLLLATVTENAALSEIVSPIEANLRDHALPLGLVGGRFFVYRTHITAWN